MKIVHSMVKFIICFQTKNIYPGMNNLSDPEFESISKTQVFKDLVTASRFRIGGSYETNNSLAVDKIGLKEKAAEIAKEIYALPVDQAKKVLATTTDIYVLKILKQLDGRKGMASVIDERIIEVNNQVGVDSTPVDDTVNDNGANFGANLTNDEKSISGNVVHTAIPALKKDK